MGEGSGRPWDGGPDGSPRDHRRLVGETFYVYARVRALVLVAIVLAALFARHVLGIEGLDVRALTLLSAWIALYGAAALAFFRRYRDPDLPGRTFRLLLVVGYGAVVLDFLSLTAAVWLVGGARSPFTAFYLLHVMASCVLLSRRAALAVTGLASALLAALVAVEWSGLASPPLLAGAVAGTAPLDDRYALGLVAVHGMLFWLSAALLLSLTGSLRSVEQRVRLANAELQRLSQQRKGFLQIATHNLASPLGAVTMLLQGLRAEQVGATTEKQRDWLDRCLKRLADAGEFLRALQTLSSLETDIIKTEFKPVDVEAIAARLVQEYADVAAARRHTLDLEVDGSVPRVVGHARLLQEGLVNYVANAIKYTPEGGHVVVRVARDGPRVRVEVRDDGPGIPPADRERIFGEFERIVSPGRGPAVRGSGLGLSIVRRVALAHGGRAWVEGKEGQGSTFVLELPALEG